MNKFGKGLAIIVAVMAVFIFSSGKNVLAVSWEAPVPTAYSSSISLSSPTQPGSRIFYISNAGDDKTASIYFWDGTNIVDSNGSKTDANGTAYGTDPMNPSGAVKPFKRWSYVAPRPSGWGDARMVVGYPWDGTGYMAPGGRPSYRFGYPDWWLFKRGETFDLYNDYLSFAKESSSTIAKVDAGYLNIGGGKSASERMVMGAYGDVSLARPSFINAPGSDFINLGSNPELKHILYQSLKLDGRGWKRSGGITVMYQNANSVDILFEDLWVDGTTGVVVQLGSPEVTFRRCLITDSFKYTDTSHTQGVYYSGNPDTKFRIEESYLLRNGFNEGDPKDAWPPSGTQIYNIFNRNMYLSGDVDHMNSGVFDSVSMIGASGDQFRPGMRIERNFFYQGYVTMGAEGGFADSVGPTGTFKDNVQQRFLGENTNDYRGQPNWGLTLTSGSSQVDFSGNIVTGAQYPATNYALSITALDWYCYSHTFHYATRNNIFTNNIFDAGTAPEAIVTVDGVGSSATSCANWIYPGVTNNTVSNNIIINSNKKVSTNKPAYTALGTTNDTIFTGNKVYGSRAEAASALGWTDPNRTLKTYMQSLGYTVTSKDGFIEYFNEATKQRKGYWRDEFTSRALNNYFRQGFGLSLLTGDNGNYGRADVNNSSSITSADALLVLRYAIGLPMSGTSWQNAAVTGDANCDGNTNAADAVLILRFSLGMDMSETNWCIQ